MRSALLRPLGMLAAAALFVAPPAHAGPAANDRGAAATGAARADTGTGAQATGETHPPEGTPPGSEATDDEPVFGRRSAIQIEESPARTVRAEAGWPLRELPDPRSRRLAAIAESVDLPLLEERDGWARVEYQGWRGWLRLAGPEVEPDALAPGEPAGAVLLAPPPLPPSAPDPARLERLLGMLGDGRTSGRLGPYALHTDVRDAELLARLDRLAAGLPEVYRQRFGLDPGAVEEETVVLFADESAYRTYESEVLGLGGLDTLGHSGRGLSVIFVGDKKPAQMDQIAIHELTHQLNRRALGTEVAPWLEEGLAEELGFSRVDGEGRIVVGSIAGGTRSEGTLSAGRRATLEVRTTTGPLASLVALLAYWRTPRRPPLAEFTDLSAGLFVQPDAREIYYAQSALLVRFLLDARKGRYAERFRSFLQEVARGMPASGDALWRYLEEDPAKLDDAFFAWVRSQGEGYGIVVTPRRS